MKNITFKVFVYSAFLWLIQSTYAADTFSGKISPIPENIQKQMVGHSWHQGCPIGFDKLAYLKLSYWGFDNKSHIGELIVYKSLALETLGIFKQLYAMKYPIERMRLPDSYTSDDAMAADNNTSAFYCRPDGQNPKKLSHHSYGIAIDINPLYNPAVEGKAVSPANGRQYLDRQLKHKSMISEGDRVFTLFTNHGWIWGGFFTEVDYMHFEKFMTRHYMMKSMEYLPPKKQINSMDIL